MTIKIICENCGRDMGTRVVKGDTVTIEVRGCKCASIGFIEGFEAGKKRAKEMFKHGESSIIGDQV